MMSEPEKIAVVAALQREIMPLVRGYKRVDQVHQDRRFTFFESGKLVVVCGGIGPEAARRASEAMISLYSPGWVVSAGFAGALDATLGAGEVFCPAVVIDAADSSRTPAGGAAGQLVSFAAVASVEQKTKLASAYHAQAVDMEAAAVARCADLHQIPFSAVKAISDEAEFEMADLARFVRPDGSFAVTRYAGYAIVHPRIWGRLLRLARNTRLASRALSAALSRLPERLFKPQECSSAQRSAMISADKAAWR